MKTLFISQDIWELVEDGYEEQEFTTTLATWTQAMQRSSKKIKTDARALLFIQQGISKTIFPKILGAKKSKDAWDIVKEEFQGSIKVISIKLQSL